MKNFFEERAVREAPNAPLNFVNAPGRPGMDGRIYVAESPFIGRQLPVGMHVPLAKQENELLLCEIGIHQSNGDAVEGEIPGGIPGILPFVGHGNDVVVVEMGPILVAAFPTFRGRLGPSGIALEPVMNVVMIELLGPEHPGKGLAHDGFSVSRKIFRNA